MSLHPKHEIAFPEPVTASTNTTSSSDQPEYEARKARGLTNRLCACGKVPRIGLICDDCRKSNEDEE